MSLIQISNLFFEYDGGIEPVFDQVSLNLDTDWRLGLIGRNGRGKTTLLRLLAGELASDGSIFPINLKKDQDLRLSAVGILSDGLPLRSDRRPSGLGRHIHNGETIAQTGGLAGG